jgi:hypothetical protein
MFDNDTDDDYDDGYQPFPDGWEPPTPEEFNDPSGRIWVEEVDPHFREVVHEHQLAALTLAQYYALPGPGDGEADGARRAFADMLQAALNDEDLAEPRRQLWQAVNALPKRTAMRHCDGIREAAFLSRNPETKDITMLFAVELDAAFARRQDDHLEAMWRLGPSEGQEGAPGS